MPDELKAAVTELLEKFHNLERYLREEIATLKDNQLERIHDLELYVKGEISALKASQDAKRNTWGGVATLIASLASVFGILALFLKLAK